MQLKIRNCNVAKHKYRKFKKQPLLLFVILLLQYIIDLYLTVLIYLFDEKYASKISSMCKMQLNSNNILYCNNK